MAKKKERPKVSEAKNLPEEITDKEAVHSTRIRVIGIGGGGSSVVAEIASRMKKASFVAANTDFQALKKVSKEIRTFPFGQNLTRGLGTGMNSELGKEAALSENEKITKLVEGQDLCVLVSCLGGGAGSGASPIFAKASHDAGNITYGIFTLPFSFEGSRKMEIAKEAIAKIKPYLNAVTVIPNEEIFKVVDKAAPLHTALSFINKSLADSLEGLIETVYDPGLINIDFADMKAIFDGRGRFAYLNSVRTSGSNKTDEVVDLVMNNPLYPYTIRGAKGILYNISGRDLELEDVSQISRAISQAVDKDARIIFGVSQDGGKDNSLKVTILATGCQAKGFSPAPVPKPLVVKKEPVLKKEEEKKPVKKIVPAKKKKPAKPKKVKKVKIEKQKIIKVETEKKKKPVAVEEKEPTPAISASFSEPVVKIRRNAIQAKKVAEEVEEEIMTQEKQWEIPAFMRRKGLKTEET